MNKVANNAVLILVAGSVSLFVCMGIRQGFGFYLPPFVEDFGFSREGFSLAIGIQNLVWGLMSPVFGGFADRRGPVPAIALGGLCYVAGLILMYFAAGTVVLIAGQILVGVALAGAGFSIVIGAVGKVVSEQHRTFALAATTAAGSLGMFLLVPVIRFFIDTLGTRPSLLALAAFAIVIVLVAPLTRLPAGAAQPQRRVSSVAALRYAIGLRSYVLVYLGFFVCGLQLVFIATHLPAYVKDLDLPASAATLGLALIGLFNIFGTLVCGWIGDRMPKKHALAVFYALRSLVIIAFLAVPASSVSVAVFCAAMGFLWLGTVPLTSGLVATMFGVKHLSMLYGFVFFFHQLGSFVGAWLGGLAYDWTGSYDLAWRLAVFMGFVAAILHLPVREQSDDKFVERYA